MKKQNTFRTILGSNIKRLRKQKKLSQKEFAEEAKLEQTSISRWEKGREFPYKKIDKIISFFNVRPFQLFYEDDMDIITDEIELYVIAFLRKHPEVKKKITKILESHL